MLNIENFRVSTTSMIDYNNNQRVDLKCHTNRDAHLFLNVYNDKKLVINKHPVHFCSGKSLSTVLLPEQNEEFEALWQITDGNGNIITETTQLWALPRKWTLYTMLSSHTDIGLHNSQYIQRHNSVEFMDKAIDLCDKTDNRDDNSKYRYVAEGTWFWNNYGYDRGEQSARFVADEYIKKGKIGVCAGVAGNHTQVFGLEELCRSTYPKKELFEKWNIASKTMTMIDNNGISWSVVQPYAEAGIENIIFAPNQWNPLPSTIWKQDSDTEFYTWNPQACGGGTRVDIRYDSVLPMLFYWQAADDRSKLLVWGSTSYGSGGEEFGLRHSMTGDDQDVVRMENHIAKQLDKMNKKMPYDIWLFCCYTDDQEPSLGVVTAIEKWNKRWQWPKIKTLGNPDEPFEIVKQKFGDSIPVIKGDITGGWYQHPLTTPELLSKKFEADRLLPTAEKLSVIASVVDGKYEYPQVDFDRAWEALLFNDEHSYGTSGYQGRRVYETWMQHNDWIDKALSCAKNEVLNAVECIKKHISADEDGVLVFNPSLITRSEMVVYKGKYSYVSNIPSLGYKFVKQSEFEDTFESTALLEPPVIENKFYVVKFNDNGSIKSIFDKKLNKEILDINATYGANDFVYTDDNHISFTVSEKASFEIVKKMGATEVIAKTNHKASGAEVVQIVSLPDNEKRIDIDNKLYHVKDLFNTNRYYRYCYFAFPFMVDNCRRYCHLNGSIAEYAKDVTGHGTDVYMAVNEWCCSENSEFGVALLQKDSELIEFDHIHPDKTDFANVGEGSHIYSYLANDWLQMHTAGGSHLDFRFRYSIVSFDGNFKDNRIFDMAERMATEIVCTDISVQKGILPSNYSFMRCEGDLRLTTLKRAQNGKGIIARLYTNGCEISEMPIIKGTFFETENVVRCSVNEDKYQSEKGNINGFLTFRINEHTEIPLKNIEREWLDEVTPAPIGSVYTGLITKPRAARGEHNGHLYLLWGKSVDRNLSHYELYRSEVQGFIPDETTFIANVKPEEYRCARYIDLNLKDHTRYFYRVRAVNKNHRCGEFSDEFSGITKEI